VPTITRISTQNRKNRFNVEIDGEFAFGVNEALLARENLYKGKELSFEEAELLKQAAGEEKLYEKALNFLSYRPRSEREVVQYLKRKILKSTSNSNSNSKPNTTSNIEHPTSNVQETQIIESAINRLKKEGYIDDKLFARWWMEQRLQAKVPRGVRLIKSELYAKGVSRDVVDEVIDSAVETGHAPSLQEENDIRFDRRDATHRVSTEGEGNAILKAALAVVDRYKNLEEPVFKRRMFAFLLRRGFEWEDVRRVVDEIAKERYTHSHE